MRVDQNRALQHMGELSLEVAMLREENALAHAAIKRLESALAQKEQAAEAPTPQPRPVEA